jgi:DNA-binding transcriptional ArsR family regulator
MDLLHSHQYCVRALTARLDISQPAVSQHLAVLKRAGLVEADREGTMVHYRVNPKRFEEVMKALGVVGRVRLPDTEKVDA